MNNRKLLQRANVLKQYEVYGYQIAYYLLENEDLAEQAARRALLELFDNDDFFNKPSLHQQRVTKQVFMKHAMHCQHSSRIEYRKEMA